MKIKQTLSCPITIRRFDTNENITFEEGTIIDVDDQTAKFLLNYRTKDMNGNDAAKFIEVKDGWFTRTFLS